MIIKKGLPGLITKRPLDQGLFENTKIYQKYKIRI